MKRLIKEYYQGKVERIRDRLLNSTQRDENGWKVLTEVKFIPDLVPYYICIMEIDDDHPFVTKGKILY